MLKFIFRKLRQNKLALFGLFLVILLSVLALGADRFAAYQPDKIDLAARLQSPSAAHWFGTDDFGRDIFSRILYGTRISLEVGIVSRIIAILLGGVLGIVAGYYGGRVDYCIMRLTDVMFAFPVLLLLIAVTAAFGPSLKLLFLAIGFVGWAPLARLLRAQVLTIKASEYLEASRALGFSHLRIIFRQVLPNALAPIIITFSLGMAAAIMAESSLSFIGLGAQPPTPSWGSMVSLGREYLRNAPWLTFFPGMFIALAVLGFNLLGDGLRDALDPKMKV
jgi:ABC-type dipeptide/oligopeptide/nickel transport system permease subunit